MFSPISFSLGNRLISLLCVSDLYKGAEPGWRFQRGEYPFSIGFQSGEEEDSPFSFEVSPLLS
jgi:hypothetical protein